MNYIDLLLICVFLLALWQGWQRGFILKSIDLLLMAGSFLAALTLYSYGEKLLLGWFPSLQYWARPLSFLLVLGLARLILSAILNLLLRDIHPDVHYSALNRAAGLLPASIIGFIYATIIAALLLALPFSPKLSDATQESAIAPKLALQVEWLNDHIPPVFDVAVNASLNKLTIDPASKTFIDLRFTVDNAKPRPDLEEKMLVLVNAERMKLGLRALLSDNEMLPVARGHSIDMFARGYFSHQTPDSLSPADRVKRAGVRYTIMGENLALGQTLAICHRGLMNSPGHKANILNPAYGRVGIGIVDGGVHGLMVTQNFRN